MKSIMLLFVVLTAVILSSSAVDLTRPRPRPTTTEKPTTTTQDPTTILKNCGETIFGTSGSIEYKLGENYTTLERCSFVIRAENFKGFVFTLDENELTQDASISILSFEERGLIQSAALGPINPLKQVFVSGSVIVVVFNSEKLIGQGFRLKFQGENEQSYSTRGNETVFSAPSGQISFSRKWNGPEPYGTFEVYVITDNHQATVSYKNVVLEVNKIHMDTMTSVTDCGRDALRIYSFSGAVKYEGVVCDLHYNKRVFETQGIFIILFKNFGDNSAKTFNLDWSVE